MAAQLVHIETTCLMSNMLDDFPPGLASEYLVDPYEVSSDTVRYGPHAFPYYMSQKQLYIDVWDGDTLLHIGNCCLNLKSALRQGKKGVVVEEEVEIVWNQV